MIPAKFDYEVAGSVEEAIELLGKEDAKLLAGGHSLLPLMKLRLARPTLLVDIGRIDNLSYVRDGGETLAIGPTSFTLVMIEIWKVNAAGDALETLTVITP